MIVDRIDRRTVRSAVELAARAPSVHNSQPWRWRIGDRTVHLHADLRRWLPVTDAEGRDLLLSLGAVLHHLRVALAASGLRATVHRFPNPDALDHVAAVELRPRVPTEADLGFAAAIVARRSDRRGYSDWEVPPALVGELIDRAAEQGATLRPMTAAGARARIEQAVTAAAAAHAALPGYHTETVLWSGRTASDDGVPAANLLRDIEGRGLDRAFPPGAVERGPRTHRRRPPRGAGHRLRRPPLAAARGRGAQRRRPARDTGRAGHVSAERGAGDRGDAVGPA